MQCRARVRIESLNYIWTTDQILADAFQRFVKVSHANRRYGSHVPGPLEARRRSANRKMGMAAAMVEQTASGFNPALLSGFRLPAKTRSPESSWQWMRPDPFPPLAPEFQTTAPNNYREGALEVAETESYTNRVNKSIERFGKLLEGLDADSTIAEAELRQILNYLRTSEDEPEARNILSLVRWLSTRDVSRDGWAALGETVWYKVQAHQVSVGEISELIDLWKGALRDVQTMSIIVGTLDALELQDFKRVVWTTSRKMLEGASTADGTLLESAPHYITSWLAVLRKCSKLQGQHAKSSIWNAIYRNLSRIFRPTALKGHLGTLEEADLARVLLRHWAHSSRLQHRDWIDNGDYLLLDLESTPRFPRKDLYHMFEAEFDVRNNGSVQESDEKCSALRNLLTVLIDNGLPCEDLASEIFGVISETADPGTVLTYINSLNTGRGRFFAITPQLGSKIIDYLIRANTDSSVKKASLVAYLHPRIPLATIQDLPIAMIDKGLCDGFWTLRIFHLLRRKTSDLQPSEREHQGLRLSECIGHLVHRMAARYASSPDLTPRTAYRRVWACYRFLRDRHVKITRTMSAAFVKAGIVRYIEAGGHVPREQVRYVLSIVEATEGKGEAQRVDQLLVGVTPDDDDALPREAKVPSPYWKHRLWRKSPDEWYEDRREGNPDSLEDKEFDVLAGIQYLDKLMHYPMDSSEKLEAGAKESSDLVSVAVGPLPTSNGHSTAAIEEIDSVLEPGSGAMAKAPSTEPTDVGDGMTRLSQAVSKAARLKRDMLSGKADSQAVAKTPSKEPAQIGDGMRRLSAAASKAAQPEEDGLSGMVSGIFSNGQAVVPPVPARQSRLRPSASNLPAQPEVITANALGQTRTGFNGVIQNGEVGAADIAASVVFSKKRRKGPMTTSDDVDSPSTGRLKPVIKDKSASSAPGSLMTLLDKATAQSWAAFDQAWAERRLRITGETREYFRMEDLS